MIRRLSLVFAVLPAFAQAGDIAVSDAMVPIAPKTAMAHAGYMTITNDGDAARSLIGVKAEGYGMAHLHRSEEKDGIATMSAVHQIDIEPGQTLELTQGGLHIMLMKPAKPTELGAEIPIVLEFANGETVPVTAKVKKLNHGHGS